MPPARSAFVFLLTLGFPAVLGQCYYPNGLKATGDEPCDPDAKNSMCCGASIGNICLSNKLCSTPDGNLIRGSCTDKNWDAPECAAYCLGASTGGTDLISCLNSTSSDTLYCCDHTTDCCDTGVGRFNVLPSDPGVWARFNNREKKYSVVGTMFSATSTAISETSTSASPSTTTNTEAATTTTDNAARHTSAEQEGTNAKESNEGLSTGAMAGIGVGAGLGLIIIVAIGFFFWRRKKQRKQISATTYPGPAYGSQQPHQTTHEAMEKAYHGAAQEMPGSVAPRHYHQHIQELPAPIR